MYLRTWIHIWGGEEPISLNDAHQAPEKLILAEEADMPKLLLEAVICPSGIGVLPSINASSVAHVGPIAIKSVK